VLLPAFPVVETALADVSGEGAEAGAVVRLFPVPAETTADSEGRFTFVAVPLAPGAHLLEAEAEDGFGNVSRRSEEVLLIGNDRPSVPTGFSGVASGDDAELSWDPSPELDLSGYLVRRDGSLVNRRGLLRPTGAIPTSIVARASRNPAQAPRVVDGVASLWGIGNEEAWIEIEMTQPRHVDEIRLLWWSQRAALDYDLLVELEGRLAPIARVRGNTELVRSSHELPHPLQTRRVRLHIYSSVSSLGVLLNELELIGIAPVTATAFTDTPDRPGVYDYTLSAIDTLGAISDEAGPVELAVSDLVPPEPPANLIATVVNEDVFLSWTASVSDDVVSYHVFRDGVKIAETAATFLNDFDLLNGSYVYHVIALDDVSNESAPSNEAPAVVDVLPPTPPVLSLSVVPGGGTLDLFWTVSTGPLPVTEYGLSRAASSGGPYEEIARIPAPVRSFGDTGLVNGVELFYVVRAFDARGQASLSSSEVSGTPEDTEPPPSPTWTAPTVPGVPKTLTTSRVSLLGISEPGTTVDVVREGARLGSARTSSAFSLVAEPFAGSFGNFNGRFALSSDRRYAAEVGSSSSLGSNEVRLYDLGTGEVRVLPYGEARSFERGVAFSPSGRRLAVATTLGQDVFLAVRIVDLESETTDVIALSSAPQAPVFLSETEIAVVVGNNDIRVLDTSARSETTIYTASSGFTPQNLTASPDGATLAWTEQSQLFVMASGGGTAELVVSHFSLDSFAWAGTTLLAYTRHDLGLSFYDTVTRIESLVPDSEGMVTPRSVGPAGAVSTFRGLVVHWVFANGARFALGDVEPPLNREFVAWSHELSLVGTTSSSTLAIVSTPGRFELEGRLVPGPNVLTARAIDAAGLGSPDSEAIELTFDDTSLADLTVDGEILVVPRAPVSGQTASVSVPVRNSGASTSEPTVVSISGTDLDTRLYAIGTVAVPALASGARTTVRVSWPTTGRLGPQRLVATLDPLEILDESDETNNEAATEVTVVGSAGLEVSIAMGRSSYGAHQNAELTMLAVNGGGAGAHTLETAIIDAGGALVASVDARSAALGYAESLRYSVFWNTEAVAAGPYRARVTARQGAAIVATSTAPFAIAPTLVLDLSATSGRSSYEQGANVSLLASLENGASNTPLRDLSLRFRVRDPLAQLVFETVRPRGYLAIGGVSSAQASWPSGAALPGAYRLFVDAFEGTDLVASTEATFAMTPASGITLQGGLALAAPAVPIGADVVARYSVENPSVVALVGGRVRVGLFDPASRTVAAFVEGALDLSPGERVSGELSVDTAGLALGRYHVVLLAGDGELFQLAVTPVSLFAIPSAPSLNSPANGASAGQRLVLSVTPIKRPCGTSSSSISTKRSRPESAPPPRFPRAPTPPPGRCWFSSTRIGGTTGGPVPPIATRRATGCLPRWSSSTR
jgi:hypothetical protein